MSVNPVEIVEDHVVGDNLPDIRERVVVSPSVGRFWPLPPEIFTAEGEWVEPGVVLAEIDLDGRKVPVKSSFRGWVVGMLALPGQPVVTGEALFWIWSS
jgi:biotin carboxyl carrier protein